MPVMAAGFHIANSKVIVIRHNVSCTVCRSQWPSTQASGWITLTPLLCADWTLMLCACCRAAKTFGDKRADVAEKGFGRPYKKVLVSASGVLDG